MYFPKRKYIAPLREDWRGREEMDREVVNSPLDDPSLGSSLTCSSGNGIFSLSGLVDRMGAGGEGYGITTIGTVDRCGSRVADRASHKIGRGNIDS